MSLTEVYKELLAETNRASELGVEPDLSKVTIERPKVGEQIQPFTGEDRFSPLPESYEFDDPEEEPRNVRLVNMIKAGLSGQYSQDILDKQRIVKSERSSLSPGQYSQYLGPLSSTAYEIEHIVPLWMGGSDTKQNKKVFSVPDHRSKTKVDMVLYRLYKAGEIDLPEARNFTLNWERLDLSDLSEGLSVGLDDAKKAWERWNSQLSGKSQGILQELGLKKGDQPSFLDKEFWTEELPGVLPVVQNVQDYFKGRTTLTNEVKKLYSSSLNTISPGFGNLIGAEETSAVAERRQRTGKALAEIWGDDPVGELFKAAFNTFTFNAVPTVIEPYEEEAGIGTKIANKGARALGSTIGFLTGFKVMNKSLGFIAPKIPIGRSSSLSVRSTLKGVPKAKKSIALERNYENSFTRAWGMYEGLANKVIGPKTIGEPFKTLPWVRSSFGRMMHAYPSFALMGQLTYHEGEGVRDRVGQLAHDAIWTVPISMVGPTVGSTKLGVPAGRLAADTTVGLGAMGLTKAQGGSWEEAIESGLIMGSLHHYFNANRDPRFVGEVKATEDKMYRMSKDFYKSFGVTVQDQYIKPEYMKRKRQELVRKLKSNKDLPDAEKQSLAETAMLLESFMSYSRMPVGERNLVSQRDFASVVQRMGRMGYSQATGKSVESVAAAETMNVIKEKANKGKFGALVEKIRGKKVEPEEQRPLPEKGPSRVETEQKKSGRVEPGDIYTEPLFNMTEPNKKKMTGEIFLTGTSGELNNMMAQNILSAKDSEGLARGSDVFLIRTKVKVDGKNVDAVICTFVGKSTGNPMDLAYVATEERLRPTDPEKVANNEGVIANLRAKSDLKRGIDLLKNLNQGLSMEVMVEYMDSKNIQVIPGRVVYVDVGKQSGQPGVRVELGEASYTSRFARDFNVAFNENLKNAKRADAERIASTMQEAENKLRGKTIPLVIQIQRMAPGMNNAMGTVFGVQAQNFARAVASRDPHAVQRVMEKYFGAKITMTQAKRIAEGEIENMTVGTFIEFMRAMKVKNQLVKDTEIVELHDKVYTGSHSVLGRLSPEEMSRLSSMPLITPEAFADRLPLLDPIDSYKKSKAKKETPEKGKKKKGEKEPPKEELTASDVYTVKETNEPIMSKDGTREVSAQMVENKATGQVDIIVNNKKIKKDFKEKAWTKPKVEGVDPLPKDIFKSEKELKNFLIEHEVAHKLSERSPEESPAEYENRINREALVKIGKEPPAEKPKEEPTPIELIEASAPDEMGWIKVEGVDEPAAKPTKESDGWVKTEGKTRVEIESKSSKGQYTEFLKDEIKRLKGEIKELSNDDTLEIERINKKIKWAEDRINSKGALKADQFNDAYSQAKEQINMELEGYLEKALEKSDDFSVVLSNVYSKIDAFTEIPREGNRHSLLNDFDLRNARNIAVKNSSVRVLEMLNESISPLNQAAFEGKSLNEVLEARIRSVEEKFGEKTDESLSSFRPSQGDVIDTLTKGYGEVVEATTDGHTIVYTSEGRLYRVILGKAVKVSEPTLKPDPASLSEAFEVKVFTLDGANKRLAELDGMIGVEREVGNKENVASLESYKKGLKEAIKEAEKAPSEKIWVSENDIQSVYKGYDGSIKQTMVNDSKATGSLPTLANRQRLVAFKLGLEWNANNHANPITRTFSDVMLRTLDAMFSIPARPGSSAVPWHQNARLANLMSIGSKGLSYKFGELYSSGEMKGKHDKLNVALFGELYDPRYTESQQKKVSQMKSDLTARKVRALLNLQNLGTGKTILSASDVSRAIKIVESTMKNKDSNAILESKFDNEVRPKLANLRDYKKVEFESMVEIREINGQNYVLTGKLIEKLKDYQSEIKMADSINAPKKMANPEDAYSGEKAEKAIEDTSGFYTKKGAESQESSDMFDIVYSDYLMHRMLSSEALGRPYTEKDAAFDAMAIVKEGIASAYNDLTRAKLAQEGKPLSNFKAKKLSGLQANKILEPYEHIVGKAEAPKGKKMARVELPKSEQLENLVNEIFAVTKEVKEAAIMAGVKGAEDLPVFQEKFDMPTAERVRLMTRNIMVINEYLNKNWDVEMNSMRGRLRERVNELATELAEAAAVKMPPSKGEVPSLTSIVAESQKGKNALDITEMIREQQQAEQKRTEEWKESQRATGKSAEPVD